MCYTPKNNTPHFQRILRKTDPVSINGKTTIVVKQPNNTYSMLDKILRSKTVYFSIILKDNLMISSKYCITHAFIRQGRVMPSMLSKLTYLYELLGY